MAMEIKLHPFGETPAISLSLTVFPPPNAFGTLRVTFGDDEITMFVRERDCDRLARAAAAFNAVAGERPDSGIHVAAE